jgi:hypothetical protein
MAALVDERLRPPRQGDSDEGRVVLLDVPEHNRWPALLALGDALFGRLDWWPRTAPDAGSVLTGALLGGRRKVEGRPQRRPSRFADAGLTILRTYSADSAESSPEIWCRCDGGPHGFLSIAAHAHADALSVEARYGGVDVLADPGTYCYHAEPEWRSYFQSTVAHNTIEVDGQWQSARGGAFLWLRHATGHEVDVTDDGPSASWTAEHDGYAGLSPAARHRRSVRLDHESRTIEITDQIEGGRHDVRMAFHLGPEVVAALDASTAELAWPDGATPGAARLLLPAGLRWSLHRGETDPILGWYSAGLGERVPAVTLLGQGRSVPGALLVTRLAFAEHRDHHAAVVSRKVISLVKSGASLHRAPEIPPEAQ